MTSTCFFILSGFIALLVFTAMGCGLRTSCKRRTEETETSTSVENSLASSIPVPRQVSRPSCMNCILIEMGEMVSLWLAFILFSVHHQIKSPSNTLHLFKLNYNIQAKLAREGTCLKSRREFKWNILTRFATRKNVLTAAVFPLGQPRWGSITNIKIPNQSR